MSAARDDVEAVLAALRPADTVVGLTDLSVTDGFVAATAAVPPVAGRDAGQRVAVVETSTGELHLAGAGSHGPHWSSDGRLAWIVDGSSGSAVAVAGGPLPVVSRERSVSDVVEAVRWSPDGQRLLLVAAEPGAQVSDVVGSGTLPGATTDRPSWEPLVDTGAPMSGWRRAWVWDLATDALTRVSPDDLNVWQAAWRGDGRIVVVASDGPTESDWYGASVVELDLRGDGAPRVLPVPAGQLAAVACDPRGVHVSVIAGPMSDRGIDVGALGLDGTPLDLDLDVTSHTWAGPDDLVFAGLRGLRTVVGRHRPSTRVTTVEWESDATCGEFAPEVAAHGAATVAWVHSYERPPALVDLGGGTERVLWQSSLEPAAGRLERVGWPSSDGTAIDGLLVVPEGSGPFPLVVHVHGGPVWAWRDEWSMHYPLTPVFVRRGFAVLHPNQRGSSGRGAGFVHDGLRDLGGRDADDIVTGVDALIAAGTVDARRVVVTGNSYGGFMSAWLATSDRFAAAAARSPVTEWVSQHLTSNLPAFDELCLDGSVLDASSEARRRSPLFRADDVTVPVLLMAGRLDLATPPDQAVMLHRALVERGRPSTLVLYPEEGHGVRRYDALVDQCVRLVEFFEAHT